MIFPLPCLAPKVCLQTGSHQRPAYQTLHLSCFSFSSQRSHQLCHSINPWRELSSKGRQRCKKTFWGFEKEAAPLQGRGSERRKKDQCSKLVKGWTLKPDFHQWCCWQLHPWKTWARWASEGEPREPEILVQQWPDLSWSLAQEWSRTIFSQWHPRPVRNHITEDRPYSNSLLSKYPIKTGHPLGQVSKPWGLG